MRSDNCNLCVYSDTECCVMPHSLLLSLTQASKGDDATNVSGASYWTQYDNGSMQTCVQFLDISTADLRSFRVCKNTKIVSIVTHIPIARQRPQHTHGQQYMRGVLCSPRGDRCYATCDKRGKRYKRCFPWGPTRVYTTRVCVYL
jgi:hypothetical protein